MALLVGGGDIFGSFPSVPPTTPSTSNEEESLPLNEVIVEEIDETTGSTNASKFSNILKVIRTSTTSTAFSCLTSLLPLFSIVLGSLTFNKCPAEPRIPLFLVIGGVLGLLNFLVHLVTVVLKEERKIRNNGRSVFIFHLTDAIFIVILVSLACSGTFLVFRLNPSFKETDMKFFCHKLTYYFAFVLSAVFFLASLFAILTGIVGFLAVWSNRKK